MKRILIVIASAILVSVLAIGVSASMAGKWPDGEGSFIGNGFPSGPHFNLNLKAKDSATFTCPDEVEVKDYYCPDVGSIYGDSSSCDENCDADCIEIYSNVIYFPQGDGSDNFTILMESGKNKPKGKPTEPVNYPDVLEVTDWCMGFQNNDNAAFRLPADPDGYAVYARLTGDPKNDPSFDFTNPELAYVEDNGQDLILLGFITGGLWSPNFEPISRTKGTGVNKATDITSLFMWTGDVCTFNDYGGVETQKCCIDTSDPLDGIYDECMDPNFEEPYCDPGYTLVSTYCTYYDDPVWVFNIAEFVGMLWDIDPLDSYKASLIQIRFYPLPLNTKEDPKP
jgi:hypothetical protein